MSSLDWSSQQNFCKFPYISRDQKTHDHPHQENICKVAKSRKAGTQVAYGTVIGFIMCAETSPLTSAPALSLLRAEVPRSLEDQEGSASPHYFRSLGSNNVWNISRATAWPSTNWLSWRQQKAQECGLGSRMHKWFPAKCFLPPQW